MANQPTERQPTERIRRRPDISIDFGEITPPKSVDMNAPASAEVIITNEGNRTASGTAKMELMMSEDEIPNKRTLPDTGQTVNDGLLYSEQIRLGGLKPGESRTMTLNFNDITSFGPPGAYRLIAEVTPNNPNADSNPNNNRTNELVSTDGTDAVIDWNATLLNAVQSDSRFDPVPDVGAAPPEASRAAALMHAAIYDAVNGIEGGYQPYQVDLDAPDGASAEAAAVGAGYTVLSALFSEQVDTFNLQMEKSLGEIADGQAESDGFAYGQAVARQLLALHENDLSVADPDTDYQFIPEDEIAGRPGWKPSENGLAVGSGYGEDAVPFAIPSSDAFVPDGPEEINNDEYVAEYEEVRKKGANADTDLTKIERTEYETNTGLFWDLDRSDSYRPPNQWNQIAEEVAVREGNSLAENARLFAKLNISIADAVIVAWDTKYTYRNPRPETYIKEIGGSDNRPETVGDPNWEPNIATPPFPDYISGHSTIGGAAAPVLAEFFGANTRVPVVSPDLPGETRYYDSFQDAAIENAQSRIFGGVHFKSASVGEAVPTGNRIGDFVVDNILQPVDASAA
jgi:hypothetical protein